MSTMVPEKYLHLYELAEKEFPGKVEYVADYDLALLDTARVVQVRDAKNRAPEKQAREYGQKMARGVEFPPGVVTNGTHPWVVDGNTRNKGRVYANHPKAPMIVIKVDAHRAPKQVQNTLVVLGSRYNQANGKALETADIELQSVAYIDLGLSNAQIAAELGVSDSKVNSWRNRLNADRRMMDLGITSSEEEGRELIPAVSVREALGNGNARALHEGPYRKLVAFAIDKQANASEVATAAKAALRSNSDEEAVEILNELYLNHPGHARAVRADNIPESVTLRKAVTEMIKLANAIERDPSNGQFHIDTLSDGIKYLTTVRSNQYRYMGSED